MRPIHVIRCAAMAAALVLPAVPATASAWQVTVNVHGAGQVVETTPAARMSCTTPLSGVSESTVTACTAGTPNGGYASFDVVELEARVPAAHYARGWRFYKWVDSKGGNGVVNCDPQEVGGDHFASTCRFQVFENLQVDLYFVDVAGPAVTSLSDPPAPVTGSSSATFSFDSDESDASFKCRLDRGAAVVRDWFFCGSSADKQETFSGLTTSGQYTVRVKAVDPTGNEGPERQRTWTVDNTDPDTWFTATPGAASQASTSFSFAASEAASFSCRLDAGGWVPCSSPYPVTGLGEGAHTLWVAAADPYGNVDPTPVLHTWTVDVTAPDTVLLSGPAEASTTPQSSATFEFASPESGASFECRLDGAAFAPCSSPRALADLPDGERVFEVRARDAAGNLDPTPVRRAWRVNSLDADTDGVNRPADCDDADAAIHPGASDVPENGIDEDCDGADQVDLDRDGDGFDRPADCDDSTVAVRPGATDVPDNGVDEDCSGADAVDLDRDRDGVARPLDCDDAEAAIRPGATDAPADGIDQDCDGRDTALPRAAGRLDHAWEVRLRRSRARRLLVSGLARGSMVRVRCRGGGCPFATKRVTPSRRSVDVVRLLKGRRLAVGARLEISVSAPSAITTVAVYEIRRGRTPAGGRFRCLLPGASKPVAC